MVHITSLIKKNAISISIQYFIKFDLNVYKFG